jgi:hypothetical protein
MDGVESLYMGLSKLGKPTLVLGFESPDVSTYGKEGRRSREEGGGMEGR